MEQHILRLFWIRYNAQPLHSEQYNRGVMVLVTLYSPLCHSLSEQLLHPDRAQVPFEPRAKFA